MLPYFVLGIALLAGFLLAGRWYATADTRTLLKALKWGLIGLVAAIALFFLATGRLAWAFMTLPALLPWFFRARAAARLAKNFARMTGGSSSSDSSEVETRFLRMNLEHGTGKMTGVVKEGIFEGRRVETMSVDDLIDLMQVCWMEDDESARVLEAFLDRAHPEWRQARTGEEDEDIYRDPSGGANMSRAEALEVLGLEEGADEEAVKAAHKRLISGLHPDHGGSDYLAAKINQAKDVLTGKGRGR